MDQITNSNVIKGYDDYVVSLGDVLRGERATQGLTLDDISEELRIRPDLLEAIEDCNPDGFVSPGYVAGNVRAYAAFLSLNPDDCFKQFCAESGFEGVAKLSSLRDTPDTTVAKSPPSAQCAKQELLSPVGVSNLTKQGFLQGFSFSGLISIVAVLTIIVAVGVIGFRFMHMVQRIEVAPLNATPALSNSISTLDDNSAQPDGGDVALSQLTPSDTLRRPTALELPKLTPRDGAIATLDISDIGIFAPKSQVVVDVQALPAPPEVTKPEIAHIDIFATKPAWIRVFRPDGDILFEKILDAGQRYRLPNNITDAQLKAGNAQSVYLIVGKELFGPLLSTGSVVGAVALQEDSIRSTYELAEQQDFTLISPVNVLDNNFANTE